MSRFYTLAYAVGFTPWERAPAPQADLTTLSRLFAREESERGAPGQAMDLGCGSGLHTIALAERGWKVTGVDQMPKALDRARKRIAGHGVAADVVRADVTSLRPEVVGSGYDFFLDLGCFHGLSASLRAAMGAGVTAIATPDATLLLLAFKAGAAPWPLPRGAEQVDIEAAFPGWVVTDTEPAVVDGMPKLLRKAAPTWYRVRRQH
jgi:SAM-dependent methyltransferase